MGGILIAFDSFYECCFSGYELQAAQRQGRIPPLFWEMRQAK
jgi:hypothetical protein